MKRAWMMPALLAVALCQAPRPAAAQSTPAAAAEQYVGAMREGDWRRVAALTHPAALQELKNLLGALALADTGGALLQPLFGVTGSAQFDALSPEEIYVRLNTSVAAASPGAAQALREMNAEILGAVMEGPDSAHVVYRMTTVLGEAPMRRVDVLSFGRHGERWLALLTSDLRGLAASLNGALRP